MNFRQCIIIQSILTSLILLSGCGNKGQNVRYTPDLPQDLSLPTASTLSSGGFLCPDQPNVVPDYDTHLNGEGIYTVCVLSTDASKVQVHGMSLGSSTICVIPAQFIDPQHVYTKPDVQNGGLLYSCSAISDSGVYAQFQSVNWNAAFIVDDTNLQQMLHCLVGGIYPYCPEYSFGVFR